MTKYRLKNNLSKKKIRELVSELIPELEIPKPSQCVMAQYGRDYVLEFMAGGHYYKATFLIIYGEAMIYLDRRTSLAERFVTVEKVKMLYEYLTTNGLIERM